MESLQSENQHNGEVVQPPVTVANESRRRLQDEDEELQSEVNIDPPETRNPITDNRNLLRGNLTQLQSSYELFTQTEVWRKCNYAMILYFIPLSIVLLTVLIVDYNRTCEKPLKLWAFVETTVQILVIFINVTIVCQLPPDSSPTEYQQRRISSLHYFFLCNRVLNVVWLVWFIIGMVWSFEALAHNSCPTTSPFLFRMCFSVIVIQMIFFGVVLLFFGCACLMAGLRIFVYLPGENTSSSRGATENMIRALTYKKFKDGLLPKEDSNCAICLSDYEVGEPIRFLPCDHHFHSSCVDQWLLSNKSCPFCKQEIDSKTAKKLKGIITSAV